VVGFSFDNPEANNPGQEFHSGLVTGLTGFTGWFFPVQPFGGPILSILASCPEQSQHRTDIAKHWGR
jgi:hypothetical protein